MSRNSGEFGLSLVEIVVVMAVIVILGGALLGVSKYITTRADEDLTTSELEVIATALEQYYDDYGKFPILTDINGDGYGQDDLETDLAGTVIPNTSISELRAAGDVGAASSAALCYILDQNPNSRSIVAGLSTSLVTSKNAAGTTTVKLRPTGMPSDGSGDVDLPRFVDAWGNSILYEYVSGSAFPRLKSMGPDGKLTPGDNLSNP